MVHRGAGAVAARRVFSICARNFIGIARITETHVTFRGGLAHPLIEPG